MPYELAKVRGGYKVQKKGGGEMRSGRRYASDQPLPLEKAKKQLAAMYISEEKYKIKKFSDMEGDKKYKVCRKDGNKLSNGRYHSTNKHLTYREAKDEKNKLLRKDREEYDKRK